MCWKLLETFCALMDLPQPLSKNHCTEHLGVVAQTAKFRAQVSMTDARIEVRDRYEPEDDETVVILVSCDGTWQKRGFTSLFGAVFVISYETGKVLDYHVMSKHCAGCRY